MAVSLSRSPIELRLAFSKAAYAGGVQEFEVTPRVRKRGPTYLIAVIEGEPERAAIGPAGVVTVELCGRRAVLVGYAKAA